MGKGIHSWIKFSCTLNLSTSAPILFYRDLRYDDFVSKIIEVLCQETHQSPLSS